MKTTFGALLQVYLDNAGMSQRELSRQLGCSPEHINRLVRERPGHRPASDWIRDCAKALNLTDYEADTLYYAAGRIPEDVEAIILRHPTSFNTLRHLYAERTVMP